MSEELALSADETKARADAQDAHATPGGPQTKKPGTDWASEIRGIFWLVLAVLGFHSFIAKPFYIPSESMLPGLLVGDQLVVSKFPYGFSFVSPTFHLLPFIPGRLFGHLPERGDVVIRGGGTEDAAGVGERAAADPGGAEIHHAAERAAERRDEARGSFGGVEECGEPERRGGGADAVGERRGRRGRRRGRDGWRRVGR